MVELNSFEAASLRLLAKKVGDAIQTRAANLVIGSALVQNDADATALNYSGEVAYVRALNDVLGMCHDVEDELLRGKKN